MCVITLCVELSKVSNGFIEKLNDHAAIFRNFEFLDEFFRNSKSEFSADEDKCLSDLVIYMLSVAVDASRPAGGPHHEALSAAK